ncbi:unnamed protein product [Protopolystoma xenopodis]|uniref:Uncharacterized protein n=1 Tax=Protopolystoma xenopodis TaxID=117903 RepID=A0A3S5CM81_9PLAT|nr:unnamed protein product [Protopolystoma xenopodis]
MIRFQGYRTHHCPSRRLASYALSASLMHSKPGRDRCGSHFPPATDRPTRRTTGANRQSLTGQQRATLCLCVSVCLPHFASPLGHWEACLWEGAKFNKKGSFEMLPGEKAFCFGLLMARATSEGGCDSPGNR